ncbi:MAG: hypothetical protein JWR67_3887 [Mucilaginibacter sp.]|nr:hypothetical protein [Mucilaginibacter sp.]
MSKRLEDFIKANREDFDDLEPGAGLWNRIEDKLPNEFNAKHEKKTFSIGFVLRVAATVIIVMSISFVLYLRSEKSNGINLAAINPEYAKQRVHYTALISNKLNELKTLSKSDPQLYSEFSAEIAKMDSTYKKLNKDLATSPNQELVLRAMIRNLQIQTEVLNQQLMIIEQFNQMKKEQPNEKDI